MYKTIILDETKTPEVQSFLNNAIAPRPICFASTIDKNGNIDLNFVGGNEMIVQQKTRLVARLDGNWHPKISFEN